jgi:hypothetical protein
MYTIDINTDIDRVNHPLRPIYVGQGSSLTIRLPAVLDPDATAVECYLTTLAGPVTKHAGALNAAGVWEIYIPAWTFPTAGETDYQIAVTDADAKRYWLGRGTLVIFAADHDALPPEPPPDGYIMYAPGGAAYRLTITTNELGESALTLIPVEA